GGSDGCRGGGDRGTAGLVPAPRADVRRRDRLVRLVPVPVQAHRPDRAPRRGHLAVLALPRPRDRSRGAPRAVPVADVQSHAGLAPPPHRAPPPPRPRAAPSPPPGDRPADPEVTHLHS